MLNLYNKKIVFELNNQNHNEGEYFNVIYFKNKYF